MQKTIPYYILGHLRDTDAALASELDLKSKEQTLLESKCK